MSDRESENIRPAERHPDLFSSAEAAAYLHLDCEATLETVRRNFKLVGYPGAGKGLMYWREDLDLTARRIAGRAEPVAAKTGRGMRIAK